jgi:NAD(P)-dependent dehydrogenase (short-subunit alcohol dehydrogenase family)
VSDPHDPPRRVALVADAAHYVGPELARMLAARDHDLVLGDASAELARELTAGGASVEVVDGVSNLARPDSAGRLVEAATARFGRIDAAVAASGQIVTGRFLHSDIEDLEGSWPAASTRRTTSCGPWCR